MMEIFAAGLFGLGSLRKCGEGGQRKSPKTRIFAEEGTTSSAQNASNGAPRITFKRKGKKRNQNTGLLLH